MKKINIDFLPDEVVANLAEKIENLPVHIQEYLLLKDLVADDKNYYYTIYNDLGDFDHYELLTSKKQILGEEFDCTI